MRMWNKRNGWKGFEIEWIVVTGYMLALPSGGFVLAGGAMPYMHNM